ncbi:MAG: amino acid permease [Pseudomonadota bacterium]
MSINGVNKLISVPTLTLISISAVISLRNFSLIASQGWASTFYYLAAGLLFLIPISLICAELASTFPKKGGVYLWVSEAFGTQSGVVAIWLEWMESVIWLPVVLSFFAGLVAYLINPDLAYNRYFVLAIILTTLWGLTFLNFMKIQISAVVSAIGILVGTIVPSLLLILLGVLWILLGKPTEIPLIPDHFFPPMTVSNFVFFSGILLSFCGMEVSAFHAQNVDNPRKSYPIATFLSTAVVLALTILGTLSIALILPANQIQLSFGTMQAFSAYFNQLGVSWMIYGVAGIALFGALASMNTWIIGPSRGLLVSAEHGDLPKFCRYKNENQSPTHILYAQGVISSILASAFVLMPTINASYWVLTVLAAQLIAIMYFIICASLIRLRYTKPHLERPYKLPGGMRGMWAIAGTAAFASLLTFFVGFFPPEGIDVGDPLYYGVGLFIAVIVATFAPFIRFKQS